jgi:hypothetical protein
MGGFEWPPAELEDSHDAALQSLWDRFADFSSRWIWPMGRYALVLLAVLEMAIITFVLLTPVESLRMELQEESKARHFTEVEICCA